MDETTELVLTCDICGQELIFSDEEYLSFSRRGYSCAPKRCRNCSRPRKISVQTGATDVTLKCVSCETDFCFSAGEQQFFKDKGYRNLPRRCKSCRAGSDRTKAPESETLVLCSSCGQETLVPFIPHLGRPSYCRECFQSR